MCCKGKKTAGHTSRTVIDLSTEGDFRRLEGVVLGEGNIQEEDSSRVPTAQHHFKTSRPVNDFGKRKQILTLHRRHIDIGPKEHKQRQAAPNPCVTKRRWQFNNILAGTSKLCAKAPTSQIPTGCADYAWKDTELTENWQGP